MKMIRWFGWSLVSGSVILLTMLAIALAQESSTSTLRPFVVYESLPPDESGFQKWHWYVVTMDSKSNVEPVFESTGAFPSKGAAKDAFQHARSFSSRDPAEIESPLLRRSPKPKP